MKSILIFLMFASVARAEAATCDAFLVQNTRRIVQVFTERDRTQSVACNKATRKCRRTLLSRRGGGVRNEVCTLIRPKRVRPVPPRPRPRPRPIPRPRPRPVPVPPRPRPIPVPPRPRPIPPRPIPAPPRPIPTPLSSLDRVEQELQSSEWRVRQNAAQRLRDWSVPRALKLSIQAMRDSDADVRNSARASFDVIKDSIDLVVYQERLLLMMTRLIDDQGSWKTRQIAARFLGRLETSRSLLTLINSLKDSDSDVRNSVTTSLDQLRNKFDFNQVVRDHLEELRVLSIDSSWVVRQRVLKTLRVASVYRTLPLFLRRIGDNDPDVRRTAQAGLDYFKSLPRAQQMSERMIQRVVDEYNTASGKWKVRLQAVKVLALSVHVSQAAVDTLYVATQDSDSDVRRAADQALGN